MVALFLGFSNDGALPEWDGWLIHTISVYICAKQSQIRTSIGCHNPDSWAASNTLKRHNPAGLLPTHTGHLYSAIMLLEHGYYHCTNSVSRCNRGEQIWIYLDKKRQACQNLKKYLDETHLNLELTGVPTHVKFEEKVTGQCLHWIVPIYLGNSLACSVASQSANCVAHSFFGVSLR